MRHLWWLSHRPSLQHYEMGSVVLLLSHSGVTLFLIEQFADHSNLIEALLLPYIDTSGGTHRYNTADAGFWGGSHADVTATVGLALLDTNTSPSLINKIR